MVVFPNIKINIGLSVTGKRPDGYHNIESIFYPVLWRETLEVTDRHEPAWHDEDIVSKSESGALRLMTYGNDIPGVASENLCIKVFKKLEEWFNLPPVDLHLIKTLPIGAGLGGGSADAAFALKALKEHYSLTISDAEAMELLASIGSDCPFFWKNKPMFVYGRGELMRPIDLDLVERYVLLVYPHLHISTREAYAKLVPAPPALNPELIPDIDMGSWREVVVNDFEKSLFPEYPLLAQIKDELYKLGAIYASMTGSGSTLYGIFDHQPTVPPSFENFITWSGRLGI